MNHCSTREDRVHIISQIIAQPCYGLISQLSRVHQVSRQTLYRWSAIGRQTLEEALGTPAVPMKQTTSVSTLVLTLLVETHASYRGIQSTLRRLHGIKISLGTIAGIVKEAGQRAQGWMKQQQAGTARALALDEQYSSQRGKAYLNVIDVDSGQVWASVPPVEVDGESWTVLLWYLSEQGRSRSSTVSDGGWAIQEAVSQVHGQEAPSTRCLVSLSCGRTSSGAPRLCRESRVKANLAGANPDALQATSLGIVPGLVVCSAA
jgi:hypothetical protein